MGPSVKKQKITILEQPCSPNTINNINFNHNGIKAVYSSEAVKYRFPTSENLANFNLITMYQSNFNYSRN